VNILYINIKTYNMFKRYNNNNNKSYNKIFRIIINQNLIIKTLILKSNILKH